MLTRRQFARGLALTVAGLLVPAPLLAAAEEPTRRLWALDGGMLGAQTYTHVIVPDSAELLAAMHFADNAQEALWIIKSGVDGFARLAEFCAPDKGRIDAFAATLDPELNALVAGGYVFDSFNGDDMILRSTRTAYTRTYRRRRAA